MALVANVKCELLPVCEYELPDGTRSRTAGGLLAFEARTTTMAR